MWAFIAAVTFVVGIYGVWWSIFGAGTCEICGKHATNGFAHWKAEHKDRGTAVR